MLARQSDSTSHRSCLAEFTGLNLLLTIPRTYSDPATDATLTGCTNPGAGSLTAVITTRVVEVLPNNDLVLEGIREVDINGDRQFIVLSGIVRAADIGPGNVVPSTAVGQMQIRYFGKGLMKDNLKPGWLVRALNKVF